jgi:hypothetical protein
MCTYDDLVQDEKERTRGTVQTAASLVSHESHGNGIGADKLIRFLRDAEVAQSFQRLLAQ